MVLAWLLLACILACGAARKCNGAKEFCELSVHQYSFGGTHNSGAFDLSPANSYSFSLSGYNFDKQKGEFNDDGYNFDAPLGMSSHGDAYLTRCYYENHRYNYKEQLEVGVRFFSPDFCRTHSGEIKDCHAPNSDPDTAAWGTTLKHTIEGIFDWLNANPDEIIMFRPENLRNVQEQNIAEQIHETFGHPCFDANVNLENQSLQLAFSNANKVKCVALKGDTNVSQFPDQKKLGYLVEKNIRLVLMEVNPSRGQKRSWAATTDSSKELDKFIDSQQAFVDALESTKDDGYMWTVELNIHRAVLPSKGYMKCTSTMSKPVNKALLTKDDDPRDYDAPEGTVCTGITCAGYRSRLEVINLNILSKGYSLVAVVVDHARYGYLKETMHRINMANFRNMKGFPEPGLEWYEVPLVICLGIGVLVLLIGIPFCAVACWRPQYCPTCIQKCCTIRVRRKAKKEQKKQEIYAKVCARAGIAVPVKEGQALAANQYPTGGYQGYGHNSQNIGYNVRNGHGQTPPVGIYGQPQNQSGPNLLPQHLQPYYNSQTPPVSAYGHTPSQNGLNFSPQHLQPYDNSQTPPVGLYGQLQSQSGPNFSPPQLQPYHNSQTPSVGVHGQPQSQSGPNFSPPKLKRGVTKSSLGVGENCLFAQMPQPQGPMSPRGFE